MKKLLTLGLFLSLLALRSGAEAPAIARKIYLPDTVDAIRQNFKDAPEWTARYQSAIDEADKLVKLSPEEWNDMVPRPEIPRAFMVHAQGCPNCGEGVFKHGVYSWIITPEKPFKVQCPNCKHVYPDNDYAGYVKSGFKDKSKLAGQYADDGWGWKKSEKDQNKYWFVAYYNHWIYKRRTVEAMRSLHTAYLLTEKPEYARTCVYLLWRLAGFWKQYDYNKQSRYALEFDSGYTGRITNLIWDAIDMGDYPMFYDAVQPFLNKPDAELERLTGKSTAAIRTDIEEKLFRQAILDFWDHRISGNFGMDHLALIRLAAVLQDRPGEPTSSAVVKRLCTLGNWTAPGETPLDYMFFNLLSTDGVPLESPSYNRGWCACLLPVFKDLKLLNKDYFSDNERMKLLLLHMNPMIVGKRNFQALGDCSNLVAPAINNDPDALLIGFEEYKLPELAGAMSIENAVARVSMPGARPDKAAIKEALGKLDPLYFCSSTHMPGFGYLTVQNRNPAKPAGLAMHYGYFPCHSHQGLLHFELFFHGKALTPDLGYPDTASGNDPRRVGWFSNTLTHNVVVVNGRMQNGTPEVNCKGYDTGDFAEYVEVDAPELYGVKQYQRSLVTLKIDDERMIAVDFFRVDGGNQHDYFFHGCNPGISTDDLTMVKQEGGTLAGRDVPYEKFYDDSRYRDAVPGSMIYSGYRGSGYQYLFDVSQGTVKEFAVKVNMDGGTVKDGDQVIPLGVDFYNLPDGDETLYFAQGRIQNHISSPKSLGFMVRRRTGKDLRSNFVSVIDFGPQPGCVAKVEALEHLFARASVLITLKDGRKLIVFNNLYGAPQDTVTVGALKLSGHTGAVEMDEKGVRRMWLYGEGKIVENGKTLLATHQDFQSKVVHVNVLKGWATMETMAPWCVTEDGEERWVFSDFRSFRTSISNKTLNFAPELPVRGKFKVASFDAKKHVAGMLPGPANLHRNLYWIAPDGKKTIGMVETYGNTITLKGGFLNVFDPKDTISSKKYAANDYYLSEIGSGQTLTIHDAARWIRKD